MSHGLLSPVSSGEGSFELRLDPRQPYLRDHDVGVPLLGTAMSLEAMAECAVRFNGRTPSCIYDVTAGEDCLVPAPKSLSCALGGGTLLAALRDGDALVFRCGMEFEPLPVPAGRTVPAAESPVVDAGTIYGCFFHGPAFQVTARAYTSGQTLISFARPQFLPLAEDRTGCPAIPVQALEFCLQAAGLLDAAFRRYMSVPLSIDRVELYQTSDMNGLWAMAESSGQGTDIRAFNVAGIPVLTVFGYRTKPMPYASEGFERLCRSFQR